MKKLMNTFKKFNNDNNGVTLVELIVAVVVLSIAIGPLLYTFVYSTRFNADSKVRQRSTNAAQTVMENFKAEDIEDICAKFTGTPSVDPVTGLATTEWTDPFLKNNTATYSFVKDMASSCDQVGIYEISGMRFSNTASETVGGYDAVIEVTEGLSTTSMPEVPVFDPRQDALWQETSSTYGSNYYNPYNVATEGVREAIINAGYDYNDITSIEISREIYLMFDNSTVYVSYQFPYRVTLAGDPVAKAGTIVRPTMPATDGGASLSKDLRNIYFYYYPAYKDSYVASATVNVTRDTIIISNTASSKVNLFVYKQLDTVKTSYDLTTCENTYKLYCVSQSSSFTTNIYDCIQANLASVASKDYSSSMSSILYPDYGKGDGNMAIKSEVGPVGSGLLTLNVNVKIYKHNDRTEILSEMNGTIMK